MATFVLVHGAFTGGWYWKRVRDALRQAGHEVFTPTFTGAGERHHLLSRSVNLSTHIRDIVNVLDYEDLKEVILVGHSYGGMVISGVCDRVPERLARLVYFDAHIAENGKSALELLGGATTEVLEAMEKADGDGWLLPVVPPEVFGVTDPADLAFIGSKRVPHPMKGLAEPLALENEAAKRVPRSFVRCTKRELLINFFGGDPLAGFEKKAREEGWPFYEIDAGHDAMITVPGEVVRVFREIAEARS